MMGANALSRILANTAPARDPNSPLCLIDEHAGSLVAGIQQIDILHDKQHVINRLGKDFPNCRAADVVNFNANTIQCRAKQLCLVLKHGGPSRIWRSDLNFHGG
jgi:hypothetical protein